MLAHMLLNPIFHSHFSSCLILQKHLTKLIILSFLKHFIWALGNKIIVPHSFLLIYYPVSPYVLNLINLERPGLTPWMPLLLYDIHYFKMSSLFLDFNITDTLMASTFLRTIMSFPVNSRLPRYNVQ